METERKDGRDRRRGETLGRTSEKNEVQPRAPVRELERRDGLEGDGLLGMKRKCLENDQKIDNQTQGMKEKCLGGKLEFAEFG